MTNDELADALAPLIKEAHARADATGNRRIKRLAALMHGAADELLDAVISGGMVSPMSGGDPKDEPPTGP